MNRIDLTGKQFGKWKVIDYSHYTRQTSFWNCLCECGTAKKVNSINLRHGKSKQCSSCRSKGNRTANLRLYTTQYNMKNRCNSKKDKSYKNYGGRKITVCKEWLEDYFNFKRWALENGYQSNLTLDRVGSDSGYNPNNCKWSTRIEQNNNKRNNTKLTFDGKTQTLAQWARELGVLRETLRSRIRYGWSVEKTLTAPIRKHKK